MEDTGADPDAELIPRLLHGETEGFRELWDKYAGKIISYVRLRSRSDEDAKDITVDTFVRCFRGIKKFKRKARLRTWLFRLSDNATVDYYRKKDPLQCRVPLEVVDAIPVVVAGWRPSSINPPDPHEDALCKERKQNFYRVLAQLSADYRRVIILRTIEGFSVAETAEILKRTEAAVKMLFLRGMENLETLLKADAYFSTRGGI